MKALLAVLFLAFVAIPLSIWQGFAISVLWDWFVVPGLGASSIGVVNAMGIALIVGLLTTKTPTHDKSKASEMLVRACSVEAVGPAVALAFGWVLHSFFGSAS